MAAQDWSQDWQSRLAAELMRMADLLARSPEANTGLLEEVAALTYRRPEIYSGAGPTFAALPRELKVMVLDSFTAAELLVLARVSTEWAGLAKYIIEKNFNNLEFDGSAASIFYDVWGKVPAGARSKDPPVERFEDALCSLAELQLELPGGLHFGEYEEGTYLDDPLYLSLEEENYEEGIGPLWRQADQELVRAAVHGNRKVRLGVDLLYLPGWKKDLQEELQDRDMEELFNTMHPAMALKELRLDFSEDTEIRYGTQLINECVGSIEKLVINFVNGVDINSFVTMMAAGPSMLKDLEIKQMQLNENTDPKVVAKAFCSLETLTIDNSQIGSFYSKIITKNMFMQKIFKTICQPSNKLSKLSLLGLRVRKVTRAVLAAAVSKLEVFTISPRLTDGQRIAMELLPGEKIDNDTMFHIHVSGSCTQECEQFTNFH